MQHITGLPRNQMVFSSLEDTILPENPVRFIDAFVEALSLETLGLEHSLIMLVYNIKRSINILGVHDLIAKLKKWNSPYKAKACLVYITNYFKLYKDSIKNELQFAA